MINSSPKILMLSLILILVACATADGLAAPSSGPVCPDDMFPCNGTCINITSPCNMSCLDGMFPCNGTCFDLSTDTQNCGSCGNVCSLGMVCIKGVCTCMAGLDVCNEKCTDTSIDPLNCGACGNICPANAICIDGSCSDMSPQICIDGDCSYPITMQLRNL